MTAPTPAPKPAPAPRTTEAAPDPLDDMPEECPLCAKYGRNPNAETRAAIRDAEEGKNLFYYNSLDELMREFEEEDE